MPRLTLQPGCGWPGRLLGLLARRNLTFEQAAGTAGIHRSTLARWIDGEVEPEWRSWARFARAFGLGPEFLQTAAEPMLRTRSPAVRRAHRLLRELDATDTVLDDLADDALRALAARLRESQRRIRDERRRIREEEAGS